MNFFVLICLFFCCAVTTCYANPFKKWQKRKVCVVGAGITGIASARHLLTYEKEFEIEVFEQNSDVGGTWLFTEMRGLNEHNIPVHSSAYKTLRTNTPLFTLCYPDYQCFPDYVRKDYGQCVYHPVIHEYLRNYTKHHHLRKHIKFNHYVHEMYPVLGKEPLDTSWVLRVRDLVKAKSRKVVCDAVMIANGHYSHPRDTIIEGLETYSGQVFHSHDYRDPSKYRGKVVLVLGAGTSGVDVAIQVSDYAIKVYLSHNQPKEVETLEEKENIKQIKGIAKIEGNVLTLKDGTTISDVEVIILCTGYVYHMPFLGMNSGIVAKPKTVNPLILDMINARYPTMAIIGMPVNAHPVPTSYSQAQFFIAMLRGKIDVPKMDHKCTLKNLTRTHDYGLEQFKYQNCLAAAAGFEPPPAYYEQSLRIWYVQYMPTDLLHFRDGELLVQGNGELKLIKAREGNNENNEI